MGQMGFFDIAQRYAFLDAKNDPLARIDEVVPWEEFRPRLEAVWRKPAEEGKSRAGRKPWDAVVMFKAIVLCELYNLSDDQVEYLSLPSNQSGANSDSAQSSMANMWIADPERETLELAAPGAAAIASRWSRRSVFDGQPRPPHVHLVHGDRRLGQRRNSPCLSRVVGQGL